MIQPSVLALDIKGDKENFEEHHWVSRNTTGGIESMSFSKQLNHQDSVEFEGRAIAGNNDYNADLNFIREGVGSLRMSFKEFTKYYDGTGGYFPLFARSEIYPVELDNDLSLNIGKFEIEGILAKEDSPEYKLAYEREFRKGSKSSLAWGYVYGGTAYDPKISPTYKDLNEIVDKVTFGVKKETRNSEASGEQSWEHLKSDNGFRYNNTLTLASGVVTSFFDFEETDSDLYTTLLRYSKDINENLGFNCGLLYNRYVGEALDRVDANSMKENFSRVEQNNIALLPNVSYTFLKDFFIIYGVKGEYLNKTGDATNSKPTENVNITTKTDKHAYAQNLQFKYKGIKDAVIFADADIGQQRISQKEYQDSFATTVTTDIFKHEVNTIVDTANFSAGYKWYANPKLNITVVDKGRNEFTYNSQEVLTGDVVGGVRGYIQQMEITSNSPLVKLNYKPLRWLGYNLGYAYEIGKYGVQTRASEDTVYDEYNADIYSLETTLAPSDALYFTLFYNKKISNNKTRASDIIGTFSQPEYTANIDVFNFSCNYAPTAKTTLRASYAMSRDDAYHEVATTTVPLGLSNLSQDMSIGADYKLNKDATLGLKYTFSQYDEQSSDGINNYKANLVSTSLRMKF